MNRLTDAKHYAGESNTVCNLCTERNIGYDRNGCLTGLDRCGSEGLSEVLMFGHVGNRLSSLSAWDGAGLLGNGYFTYDAMGNMLTDSRKGLQISYNLTNLPKVVRRADGATLTYTYLADGTKWSANPSTGSSLKYHGSFVYKDDGYELRPSSIAWDEGRISYHYAPEMAIGDTLVVDLGEEVVIDSLVVEVGDSLVVEDGICDEWHVRDHLGSVRAVVGIGNYITGIRELNTYLPFGTRIPGSIQAAENRHRFSGKEEQGFGLDSTTGIPTFTTGHLDFGARYYDPYTCRWTTIDPMAGKYHSLSPYCYCINDPINKFDPNGSVAAQLFGAAAGATVEIASQIFIGVLNGESFKNSIKKIDWIDVGVAAAEGAITAGASAIKNAAAKTAVHVATSTVGGAMQGKFNFDFQKGLEVNTNEQAAFTAVTGAIAGSANLGGKTVHLQNTRTNKTVVEAARNTAQREGRSLSKEEAKAIAAKNTARNASVKATNQAATDVVNAAKMAPVYLPNSYIWKKVNDEEVQY